MICYQRVTLEDRYMIKAYQESKVRVPEIAQRLKVHKSTIYRELKRNSVTGDYQAKRAHYFYCVRFLRCRKKNILSDPLLGLVERKIKQGWSPQQVSGRLRRERNIHISHETIYRLIRQKRISSNIYAGLRRYKKKGAGRYKYRRHRPEWLQSIHNRNSLINKRKRIGDWERDTLFLANRRRLIACVERKSRYLKLAKVKEPYCIYLTEQTKQLLKRYKVKSITNDNGSEFWDAYRFKMPVYYCDPACPHQKGTVENTIGLIRQYITKKANYDDLTDQHVAAIEKKLNLRPRRILDYKTPYEVLFNKTVALVS